MQVRAILVQEQERRSVLGPLLSKLKFRRGGVTIFSIFDTLLAGGLNYGVKLLGNFGGGLNYWGLNYYFQKSGQGLNYLPK